MLQLLRTARVLRAGIGLGAAVAALGATLPTAEAQPAASRPPSCFYASQIENTRMVNDRVLYIRTSARGYYRMDFASDCDADANGPLIIHPFEQQRADLQRHRRRHQRPRDRPALPADAPHRADAGRGLGDPEEGPALAAAVSRAPLGAA